MISVLGARVEKGVIILGLAMFYAVAAAVLWDEAASCREYLVFDMMHSHVLY